MSIRHGYYPTDNAEQAWEIDSVLDSVTDLISGLTKIMWETDPEKKLKNATDFFTGVFPVVLKAFSNRLA